MKPSFPITSTPGVMGGVPCVRGTRIPTTAIESFRRAGHSHEAIYAEYPTLSMLDICAAIAFEQGRRYERARARRQRRAGR